MRIFLSLIGLVIIGVITWLVLPSSVKVSVNELTGINAFYHNTAGAKAYKDGDLSQALSDWTQGLASNPEQAILHYNVGNAFQGLKKGDDAFASYGMTLKSSDAPDIAKFSAEYNMGTMAQANKDVELALKHYQAALEFNPDSLETKINIELLIAQGGGGGEGKEKSENGEGQDKKEDGEGDKDKEDPNKQYAPNKPQKPQFKSEDLTPGDVNKILGEIKQQEQRIRAEYSRKEPKEGANGKDW